MVSPSNLSYYLEQLMLVGPGYGPANNTKESGGSSFGVVQYRLYNINLCHVGYTLELVGTTHLIYTTPLCINGAATPCLLTQGHATHPLCQHSDHRWW